MINEPAPDAQLPQWAWAFIDWPTFRSHTSEPMLSIATHPSAPDSDDDPEYLYGPAPLGHRGGWYTATEQLRQRGWNKLGKFNDYPGRGQRSYCRVRPNLPGVTPDDTHVPYAMKVDFAFRDPWEYNDYFYDDSTRIGPDPGWMLSALKILREDNPIGLVPSTSTNDERQLMRNNAHNSIAEFNDWVRTQVRTHGWIRAGTVPGGSEWLLRMVIADPDETWQREARDIMYLHALRTEVDPDDLARLDHAIAIGTTGQLREAGLTIDDLKAKHKDSPTRK